jgi:hypothetical protein
VHAVCWHEVDHLGIAAVGQLVHKCLLPGVGVGLSGVGIDLFGVGIDLSGIGIDLSGTSLL